MLLIVKPLESARVRPQGGISPLFLPVVGEPTFLVLSGYGVKYLEKQYCFTTCSVGVEIQYRFFFISGILCQENGYQSLQCYG